MATNKTNQPTTEVSEWDARMLDLITSTKTDPEKKSAKCEGREAIETVTLELAHREALAEDNERDARDWSAFIVQVAARKADDVREQSDMDE